MLDMSATFCFRKGEGCAAGAGAMTKRVDRERARSLACDPSLQALEPELEL